MSPGSGGGRGRSKSCGAGVMGASPACGVDGCMGKAGGTAPEEECDEFAWLDWAEEEGSSIVPNESGRV